jgi:hypothetical protein
MLHLRHVHVEGVTLRIPRGWNAFVFRGRIYRITKGRTA